MIFTKIKNFLLTPQVKKPSLNHTKTITKLSKSWLDQKIPEKQWRVVHPQLLDFKLGKKVELFEIFCNSIKTCLNFLPNATPTLLEIGCSSGYHGFVLSQRFPEFKYTGVDFSPEVIAFGKSQFPGLELQVQNATSLNFPGEHFGVVISGCVLLHLDDWKLGIKESCRIAQNCVIFHRTPVTRAPTALFTKKAYGVNMFEWSFNESEFVSEVESHGFRQVDKFPINPDGLITYKFRKSQQNTYVFVK